VVKPSVVKPSVVKPSVVKPSVVKPSVVKPSVVNSLCELTPNSEVRWPNSYAESVAPPKPRVAAHAAHASVTGRPNGRIEHASPAVRQVVRRFPVRGAGRSRLDALYYQLDAGLRR
jgi:hypothetical protein